MNFSGVRSSNFNSLKGLTGKLNSGTIFAFIIFSALIAFEIFNYSTTDFALRDLLGDLKFAGVRWATILSIAFCGIDFAGIARLFTPEQGTNEPKEIWYLFGAWLLAATMNAALTWWGVSMAIATHNVQSASVIDPDLLYKIVPLFVAIMVWVIRILIIGSFSVAGDRIFNQQNVKQNRSNQYPKPTSKPSLHSQTSAASFTAHKRQESRRSSVLEPRPSISRPEPTYHQMSSAVPTNQNNNQRNF